MPRALLFFFLCLPLLSWGTLYAQVTYTERIAAVPANISPLLVRPDSLLTFDEFGLHIVLSSISEYRISDPYSSKNEWQITYSGVLWNGRPLLQKSNGHLPLYANCVAFQAENVWFGNNEGLFRMSRSVGEVEPVHSFSDLDIRHIDVIGDSIILNKEIYYIHQSDCRGKWKAPWAKSNTATSYEYGHTISKFLSGTPDYTYIIQSRLGRTYNVNSAYPLTILTNNDVWVKGKDGKNTLLNLISGQSVAYTLSIDDEYNVLDADSGYVYIGTKKGILIMDKSNGAITGVPWRWGLHYCQRLICINNNLYIIKSDTEGYVINRDWFISISVPLECLDAMYNNRLTQEQECRLIFRSPVETALSKYVQFKARYSGENDEFIHQLMHDIWHQWLSYIPDSIIDAHGLLWEKFVTGSDLNRWEKQELSWCFYVTKTQAFDFANAKKWQQYFLANTENQALLHMPLEYDKRDFMHQINQAAIQWDSIHALQLPRDALLMAEADVLLKVPKWIYAERRSFCGFGRPEYIETIPFATSRWQQVINEYPDGPWADNAAYRLITAKYPSFGYIAEDFSKAAKQLYLDIIQRHPKTELKSQILLLILRGELSQIRPGSTPSDKPLTQLKNIERQLLKLRKEASPELLPQIEPLITSCHKQREWLEWEFSARPLQQVYTLGEPIVVEVGIKNHSKRARYFYNAIPRTITWNVKYLSIDDCILENEIVVNADPSTWYDKVVFVKAGKTAKERINLFDHVFQYPHLQRSTFKKKGIYQIEIAVRQANTDTFAKLPGFRIEVR